jgi:hypothetical protein
MVEIDLRKIPEVMMKRISVHPPSERCPESVRMKCERERMDSVKMSEIWPNWDDLNEMREQGDSFQEFAVAIK